MKCIYQFGLLVLLALSPPACGPMSDVTELGACDPDSSEDGCAEAVEEAETAEVDEVASTSQALTSQELVSNWTCAAGVSCEDLFDFNVPANTRVTMRVTRVTGSSILRLAAFGPNVFNTNNFLTGDRRDWNCNGTNTDTVSFTTTTAGIYRFAIGRDGTSTGTTGSYTVVYEANPSMTFVGQAANNVQNTRLGRVCGWSQRQDATFSCSSSGGSVSKCQNVWDLDVPAATNVTLTVGSAGAGADMGLSLFAPGVPLDGMNLFTGRSGERSCVGQGQQDTSTVFVPTAGRYRFVVTFLAFTSQPGVATGNYTVGFGGSQPLRMRGRTVTNGPGTATRGSICEYRFEPADTWLCPRDVPCQDVFDFQAANAANITVGVNAMPSRAFRVRLGVFGSSVSGLNLLNMKFSDRQCAAAGAFDSAVSMAVRGRFRAAFGREAVSTPENTGYGLVVSSPEPLAFLGNTINNAQPGHTATSCP